MMKRHSLAFVATCSLTLSAGLFGQAQVSLVHSLIGTAADGQTFPSAAPPFAMTQWTPATRTGEAKCIAPYYYGDRRFYGIRGSHFLSGSCTQDYGSMQVMAGSGTPDLSMGAPSAALDHAQEEAHPHLYRVRLPESGVELTATGTERAGIVGVRVTRGGRYWVFLENNARPGDGETEMAAGEVVGTNRVRRIYAGQGKLAGFAGHFVYRFDHAPTGHQAVVGHTATTTGKNMQDVHPAAGMLLFFDLKQGETLSVRIGTSFVSADEARRNLDGEIGAQSIEQVAAKTRKAWQKALGAITVAGNSAAAPIFYTALFHSMTLPRIYSDRSGTYPSFAGGERVEHAQGYTYYDDFSIWDTFRALHPLLTVLDPERNADMCRSLIAKGEQGGFLPIFPAWSSYTSEMVGDHADAILADAIAKHIAKFDVEKAYVLMRRNATVQPEGKAYEDGRGRRSLNSYLKYGYIPLEDRVLFAFHGDEQVSRTLEYAYDDALVGRVAASLGKKDDAAEFARRGENWRKVLDPSTGFARGRHADGSWATPFDPAKPASYVTEAFPFQYTFFVPQNLPGLIAFEGGPKPFAAKLDELFRRKLYQHGNEPSHHIAYLYNFAGEPAKTEKHVREILDGEYRDSPDGLAGNDDAGQMSAWYVMSALGLYQVTPGVPVYSIGTPLFPQAEIHLPNGRTLRIRARGASATAPYIAAARLNGKPMDRSSMRHDELLAGGDLEFTMSSSPDSGWATHTPVSDATPSPP